MNIFYPCSLNFPQYVVSNPNMVTQRTILGIDPGTNIMGYGIIEITGKQMRLLHIGVLDMRKIKDGLEKLGIIFTETTSLIEQWNVTEMAIEAPFYGKNIQSMLKLGRAQGAAITAGIYKKIQVEEYSPRRIKQSVTGKGAASKEQVAAMLIRLLGMKEVPSLMDATDGLAVAVCHYFSQGSGVTEEKKSYGSWESFLKNNPGRLK